MYLKQVSLSDKFTSKYCLEVNLLGLSQTLVSCQNITMDLFPKSCLFYSCKMTISQSLCFCFWFDFYVFATI